MKILSKITYEIWEKLIKFIRLFFTYLNGGEKCVVCGNTTYAYIVCKNCRHKYFNVTEESLSNRCKICGKNLISTKILCSKCKENPILINIDKITPLFSYRLWNKELLFQWKINCVRNLSFFFSKLVARAMEILKYKYIVPVPPRKGKIKKNGWDQINELCSILRKKYGYIILNVLERHSTEQQKKLNRVERLETIKSAYSLKNNKLVKKELNKGGCNGVFPDAICLIDDVCTTGATIESCGEILKKAGVLKINVITLFIVD